MWIHSSVLIWTYFLVVALHLYFFVTTEIYYLCHFLLLVYILSFVVSLYTSSPLRLAVLRSRMMQTAIVAPVSQLLLFCLFTNVFTTFAAESIYLINPSYQHLFGNEKVEEELDFAGFVKLAVKRLERIRDGHAETITDLIDNLSFVLPFAIISVSASWVLTKSYLSMATEFRLSRITIKKASVRDIVSFSNTSTLGLLIGKQIWHTMIVFRSTL